MELKSPKTFLYSKVYTKVPKVLKKRKAKEDEEIPNFKDYDEFLTINYRVNQLKKICNHYKIKKTGNKDELIFNIYNYLKFSLFAEKIQKISRGGIVRYINRLKGEGVFSRSKCVNDSDFYTFEPLGEICYDQFYSFSDSDGFIYGFDIKSLSHLILMDKEKALNPYNRNKLPENILSGIKKLKKITKRILNRNIELKLNNDDQISEEKMFELKIIEIFQKINSLGNYSDSKWFTDLNRQSLIIFIRELLDIWSYRAQLSIQTQRQISPPNGNPFYNININYINTWNFKELQKYSLSIIDNLVNSGITNEFKSLGAYYVLASLTLVNQDARNCLPWLYQSVSHN